MAELNPDPSNPKSGLQERVRGFRLTSKYQKSGEAYLQRRNEEALVRRDSRWIDDVKKYQGSPLYVALAAGLVGILGSVIAAVIFPAGKVGDGELIQDMDSGALYVKVGDALSPVPNVTSGQLIIGSPAQPVQAKPDEIATLPRGPMVGIPYAPNVIRNTDSTASHWAVCDTTATGSSVPLDPATGLPTTSTAAVQVTVIGGDLATGGSTTDTSTAEGGAASGNVVSELTGNQARVVSFDNQTWLLYSDRGVVARARVDLRNSAVREALGIPIDEAIIPMSVGLFNSLASREPIDVPPIVNSGTFAQFPNTERIQVGTVIRVATVDGGWAYYIVAVDGIQQISQTAATILQTASPIRTGVVEIASAKATMWPKVGDRVAVDHFPAGTVSMIDPVANPVTCYAWARDGAEPTVSQRVVVAENLPLTEAQSASRISLVGAAGAQGTIADDVYLPPTSGRYVYVTGAAADTRERGGEFWVADTGIRYGIDDQGTSDDPGASAAALGLSNPVPAPWTVISLFAPGPTLSRASASIRHDGGPDDPIVAALETEGAN